MTTRTTPLPRVALLLATLAPFSCATTSESTRAPKPAELDAMKAIGDKAPGTIVWTSARGGLPHLLTMRTDGSDLKSLTKGDFTDWRPRVSPDGTKVLFSRSQNEGLVREADANAPSTWDLYTIGLDGKGIAKEVEDANWGSWISNDEVLFQRGGKLLRTKLGGDDEAVVLDLSMVPTPDGDVVQQATLSPSGHLIAMSLAGARPQVGIWHLKKQSWSLVGAGTQIEWAPDGKSVYWVSRRGKGFGEIARVALERGEPVVATTTPAKTEASDEAGEAAEGEEAASEATDREKVAGKVDPTGADPTQLLDLPGKRSHEFFPRLSSDGKWMVFGAARGGGQRDVEDFEIFLWEVGTPPKTAVRLTYDAANDRWPDLVIGGEKAAAPADEPKKAETSDKTETPAAAPVDDAKRSEGGDAGEAAEKAPESAPESATQGEDAAPASDEAEPAAKTKTKAKKAKSKKKR